MTSLIAPYESGDRGGGPSHRTAGTQSLGLAFWVTNLGFWGAIAAATASAWYAADPASRPFLQHLAYTVRGWAPWPLLTAGMVWLVPRLLAPPKRPVVVASALVLGSGVWVVVYSTVMAGLDLLLAGAPLAGVGQRVVERWSIWLWFDYLTYWGVAAVAAALFHRRAHLAEVTEHALLKSRARDLELRYRVRQLQPHFLYNALNGVAGLIRGGRGEQAAEMVDELGALLRVALELEGVGTVPLERELELVRAYLRIQEHRFDRDLRVEVQVEPQLLALSVPPLILQPLVENALEHGSKQGSPEVRIDAVASGEGARISVANRGTFTPRSAGKGLESVRRRLPAIFGPEARLEIGGADGWVVASVVIPHEV